MYHSFTDMAEKCLDGLWGKRYESGKFTAGWNKGTPAHQRALSWAKANFERLKVLPWPIVFKQYQRTEEKAKHDDFTYDHF